jgi:YbbR domain-containing protein
MLEILIRNWPFKLLSLALAFALWVAVTGENIIVQDYDVPLEIALGDGFTLVGSPPDSGDVRLRGPETLLRRINPLRHEMELLLDLSEATPGERTIQLGPDNLLGLPRGVEVARIVPNRLSLVVDEQMQRTIPVAPSFMGEPPAGYSFYGVRVTPETLTVVGPKSKIEAVTRMRTDPIPLESRMEPFVARVGAVPDSPEIRVLDSRLLTVRVEVDVAPVEVVFDSVPVVLAGQVHEASMKPVALRVVLSGPPALLERIEAGQIRAVVDVSGLAPRAEPYDLIPRVEFMEMPASDVTRIGVKSVRPESVAIRLGEQRIST